MENVKVLINESKLENRVKELAKQIEKDYKDKDILFLGVLKGSAVFMVELAKKIKNNVEFEFVEISSYEGTNSTNNIKLTKDITRNIEGRDIIIVEDIIDTGKTLDYLINYLSCEL